MQHELKILPQYFKEVQKGNKKKKSSNRLLQPF